jgi:hypothetical protein
MSLSQWAIRDLELSGINEKIARQSHIEDLSSQQIQAHLGLKTEPAHSGYLIPYFTLAGNRDEAHDRVKMCQPITWVDSKGKERTVKYLQRSKSGCGLYLPRLLKWVKIAKNPNERIVVAEGEKKAIAGGMHGLNVVGAGGIWNLTPRDELLPQLDDFALNGRNVDIAFDPERDINPDVRHAEQRTGGHLFQRGAHVQIVVLPAGLKLDDFFLKHSIDDYAKLDRIPFDAIDCLSQVRTRKGNADQKRAASAKVVLDAMKQRGDFHKCRGELLFFDKPDKVLLALDDPRSRELRAYISARFGLDGASSEWAAVHEALCNHAANDGVPTEAYAFAYDDKASNRLYIAASDRDMFRVTTSGYERVDNGCDGVLMRSRGNLQRIELDSGKPSKKALDLVVECANFADGKEITAADSYLLLRVAVLAVLFPELMRTRPLPLFHGEKGSGKTVAGKAVGISFFGSQFQVGDLDPKKLDGLDASLVTNPFTVCDNVDGKIAGLENRLALAATRGEIVRRKLYVTLEEHRALIISFLWLTSRDPASFTRDDVLDRLLYLLCARRESFEAESMVLDRIEENRPAFWKYVLSILPDILKALRAYKPKAGVFRMADFANFALAIAPVLGVDRKRMLAALQRMEREKEQFASSMSVLPAAFEALIKEATAHRLLKKCAPDYIGVALSATELLTRLAAAWPQGANHFPFKRAQSLGRELAPQLTTLRSAGIDITAEYDSDAKSWRYVLQLPAPEPKK